MTDTDAAGEATDATTDTVGGTDDAASSGADDAIGGGRPILETTDLTKRFGALTANDGLDVAVSRGDIHGIIGPNGSGKTTFFNVVTGFHDPDAGAVRFDGTDVTGWAPHRIAQRGLGRTFQIVSPFEDMTVRDNLLAVNAHGSRDEREARAAEILELLELDGLADHDAAEMSGGQQKLLELARVLMLDPELVLLDEPTAGINPVLADRIVEYIHELNDRGTTFVVIEHDMQVMRDLADVVTVLDGGRVVVEGTFEEVTADDRVREAYLGSEGDDPEPATGASSPSESATDEPTAGATTTDASTTDASTAEDAAAPGAATTAEPTAGRSVRGRPPATGPRLRGTDIVTGYGKHQVLHGVSVESHDGVTGIFGPNGSGKSTLLKALNGLVPVWEGSVEYGDRDITGTNPEDLVDAGIVTLPQDSGVFRSLTVAENLRLGAYTVDDAVRRERLDEVFDAFPVLAEKRADKADSLSGGQRMMLSFGRAMMSDADVYLLDEPSAGLAPSMVDDAFEMVRTLADRGGQVVMIEQNVRAAFGIADYVYLLAQGDVQFEGTTEALRDQPELMEVYLGLS